MAVQTGTQVGGESRGESFSIRQVLDAGDSLKIQPSTGVLAVQNIMAEGKISYHWIWSGVDIEFDAETLDGAVLMNMLHWPCFNSNYLQLTDESSAENNIVVTGIREQ